MRSGHQHFLKAQTVPQRSTAELQKVTGGCRSVFAAKDMRLRSKGFTRGQPQPWGGTSFIPAATTHMVFWGGGGSSASTLIVPNRS